MTHVSEVPSSGLSPVERVLDHQGQELFRSLELWSTDQRECSTPENSFGQSFPQQQEENTRFLQLKVSRLLTDHQADTSKALATPH